MVSARTAFTTRHFFDGDVLFDNVEIVVHEGNIVDIRPSSGAVDHFLVSPGLVDIQMNGYKSIDVADADSSDLTQLLDELRERGTFRFLATLVSAPLDDMMRRANALSEFVSKQQDIGLVGLHLEGPFLGAAPGAHVAKDIVTGNAEWISALPESVRMMTVAPDNAGAESVINHLANRGVVASLGHSNPTHNEYQRAIAAGARSVTHLFNAMSGVHHRNDGLAAWALVDDRVKKGLIADGVHVSDAVGQLAGRAIPVDCRYLVSDSIAWEGTWAARRGIQIVDGAPRLATGTLAGTSVSLAECVANAVTRWKWPLDEALRCASGIPARLIGLPAPRIARGLRAECVCWDENLVVERTIGGRLPEHR